MHRHMKHGESGCFLTRSPSMWNALPEYIPAGSESGNFLKLLKTYCYISLDLKFITGNLYSSVLNAYE